MYWLKNKTFKHIYFDNAATTIHKPSSVAESVLYAMSNFGNPERGAHSSSLSAARCVYETRVKLANFFGTSDPSTIVFTSNATSALNTAIYGLVNPGDKVVTTATEHNSILRPLYKLAGIDNDINIQFKDGVFTNENFCSGNDIKLYIIEADDCGLINWDAMERTITHDTKAVVVSHASNVTGNINNVSKVAEMGHSVGAFVVVDAAQTAGLVDIDVFEMGADVLCFTGHKGLYGPQGTGGMYVGTNVNLQPLVVGGSGVQTYKKIHPLAMPNRLEAGTLNSHGIAGLNAALDFLKNFSTKDECNGLEYHGIRAIKNYNMKLLKHFYEGVCAISNIKVYGDFSTFERCAICSINCNNYSSSAVADTLSNDFNIDVRAGGHCAPLIHQCLGTVDTGIVRFSFSCFNTVDEINHTLKILQYLSCR